MTHRLLVLLFCVFSIVSVATAQIKPQKPIKPDSLSEPQTSNEALEEPIPPGVLPNVFPPSPDAAALGRYGEIPVNLYTGVPAISIPLFEAKGKKLTVPVSLSYHAQGNKVEDNASSVGLGWSLMAGGAITRTMRGIPDETQFGFINGAPTESEVTNNVGGLASAAARGERDTHPDLFYFNFGAYSGRFFFDRAGNVYVAPHQKFKVRPPFGQNARPEGGWSVITDDGTEYVFTATEVQTVGTGCAQGSGITSYSSNTYISSWYLTKIISSDGTDEVSYTYTQPQTVTYSITGSASRYHNPVSNPSFPSYTEYCANTQTVHAIYPQRIDFSNGYIHFSYGSRTDLSGAMALQRIGLYTL